MNAVRAARFDHPEEKNMSFDEDPKRAEQFGELRANVDHLQRDVTEIKADLRTLTQRVEDLRKNLMDRIDVKTDALRDELSKIKASIASAKIWALTLYIGLAGALFY